MAFSRTHCQPFIEWSVLAEKPAIVIPKTDPGEDPDERFSIMVVHVLDLACNGFWHEKV
jgi:hypothetical protein